MTALELMFYLAVFVAALFAFDLVMNFASSLQSSRALAANLRARLMAEGKSSAEVLSHLTRRDIGARESWVRARLRGLDPLMQRGGMRMSAMRYVAISAICGLVLALVFWVG